MDPISIIGLLASLSTLIDASNSVCNVIKTFKDTGKEIAEISNNVSVFTEALKGFDRILRGRETMHRISPTVIRNALDNSQDTIKDLEKRLLQILTYESSTMRRMKWVQQKSEFRRLLDQLREQNAVLQTFLALTHAETFLAMVSQHPQLALLCSSTEDEARVPQESFLQPSSAYSLRRISNASSLESLERITSQSDRLSYISTTSSFATSISSQSDGIEPCPSVSEFSSTEQEAPQSSTRPLTTTYSSSSMILNLKSQSGSQMKLQNDIFIHEACRYNCFCACHEKERVPSQKNKFIKMKSTKVQCTESTCRNSIMAETQNSAYSRSFRKIFADVMSSKSIRVRYNLNTYRMIPEGAEAMRHIKHGNIDRLKALIDSGVATLWDTAPDGWSLLHTAAYNRQLPIVKYLLDLGAETDTGDVGSRLPGHFAVLKSLGADATQVEQDIAELFSRKDDCMIDFEFTPVHVAVLGIYDATDEERPSLEALIELIDDANNAPFGTDWKKWKLDFRNRSPLFGATLEYFRESAFDNPHSKPIHNLLDQKDKKNCWTPLHWAASAGRVDKMKILVSHGADPFLLSALDQSILHAAAESKLDHGLAGALAVWKANPHKLSINQINRWGETALHVAAWCSAACVKLLLEAGADPDVQQEDGQVPLHCAGLSGQGPDRREIVTLFCSSESKIHINTQDTDGRPPIFDFLDDSDCIEMLVQSGAKLNLFDSSERTFFHHACIQDESDALRTAIRLGVDPQIAAMKDQDGNTPLMDAISHGHSDCAMILLELSDVGSIIRSDGWTAAHLAAKSGDPDVLEAIFKHPSFVKGMRTSDDKTIEFVAMEAGTWSGKIKSLVRKYNSLA